MKDAHRRVIVWDMPTRLFHWLLVALVLFSYITYRLGWIDYHFISGYSVLALLGFRLIWGVIGSDTARFSRFLRSPFAAVKHLLHFVVKEPDTEVGHNAAGGWMVLVLLLLLLFQAGTGLASNDDIASEGPLAKYVGKDWSDYLTALHAYNFKLIEIAVALHILAVIAYAVIKRHNLVRPMIFGHKILPADIAAPQLRSPFLALAVIAVMAIGVWVLATRL